MGNIGNFQSLRQISYVPGTLNILNSGEAVADPPVQKPSLSRSGRLSPSTIHQQTLAGVAKSTFCMSQLLEDLKLAPLTAYSHR